MSEPATTRPPGRGLRLALILSLALNLLIVGALVGLVIIGAGRRSDGDRQGLRALGLTPILPMLSADDRSELAGRLRASRSELAEGGRPFGRAVRSFVAALRSEPFDRAAADAALAAQRAHGATLQEHGHSILLDQIETMSEEERAALATRIENVLRRGLDRRFGGDGRGEHGPSQELD